MIDGHNELVLHGVEIDQTSELVANPMVDIDPCVDRLKGLFDDVCLRFQNKDFSENKKRKNVDPSFFGDGQALDLFKIFRAVWNKGGCDFVSENGLWGSVAEECKIDCNIAEEYVKTVYMKYISELDRSFKSTINSKLLEKGNAEDGKSGLLVSKLQEEFSGFLQGEKKKNGEIVVSEQGIGRTCLDADNLEVNEVSLVVEKSQKISNDFKLLEKGNAEDGKLGLLVSKLQEEFSGFLQDEKKKNGEIVESEQGNGRMYHDVDNLVVNEVFNIVENSQQTSNDFKKRKRNSTSLSAMVDWVTEVAKHPDDVAIGREPTCFKWKNHIKNDLWAQALLAREALRRFSLCISTAEDSQKKLKMDHPSMYEDSSDKIINSKRVNSMAKPRICPCFNSSSAVHKNVFSPLEPLFENNPKEQGDPDIEILETKGTDSSSDKENLQKRTSVGSNFQAQVPKWTGVVSESDSKWLGFRMWHPANEKYFSNTKNYFLENGKNKTCGCRFPSSVACVRFHIAENRMKLRREIGSLFYKWNFHRMGEEVSLSWTIEEEKRFILMERLDLSSPGNCFWDNIAKFFPEKSKENLVSYYFNVFLVGRRAYQNRVTPNDVDSDDDDGSAFGCVGGRFGNEALRFGQ